MKLVIYRAMGGDGPKGAQYVAQIYTPQGDRLPVIFSSDDFEAVQVSARAHWDEELAKAKRKATPRKRKKKGDPAPETDDEPEDFV